MGLVQFIDPVVGKPIEYNVSDRLEPKWAGLSKQVIKENDDRVYVVIGQEGSGKSTFTFQQAKFIDHSFNLDRICFTADQFLEQITSAPRGAVVVFDEAFRGFSSKSSQSKVNKVLVQAMMEVRRRNLIIFIVIPSLILLEHYIVVHRSNAIFSIYKRNPTKGRKYWGWKAYGRNKSGELYDKAKKNYGRLPKIFTSKAGKFWARKFKVDGVDRWLPYETFDEKAYDTKKGIAFGDKKSRDEMDIHQIELKSIKKVIGSLELPIKTKKDLAEQLDITTRTLLRWKNEETEDKTDKERGHR